MHVITKTEFNATSTINIELVNVESTLLKQQLDAIVSSVSSDDKETQELVYAFTDCIYDALYKYLD